MVDKFQKQKQIIVFLSNKSKLNIIIFRWTTNWNRKIQSEISMYHIEIEISEPTDLKFLSQQIESEKAQYEFSNKQN